MSQERDYKEVRLYLLGRLSDEIRQRVEERLLTEEDFLEDLRIAEVELIEEYVDNDLPSEDRQRFEQYFLSTVERRQDLKFAKALHSYISKSPDLAETAVTVPPQEFLPHIGPLPPDLVSFGITQSARTQAHIPQTKLTWTDWLKVFWGHHVWAMRAAMAVAVVAIIAGPIWFYQSRQPKTFVLLTLSISNMNRGDGAEVSKISLPLKTDALRISLMLPGAAETGGRYRAELENENGEKRTVEVVEQDSQSASVVIPTTQLARGRYAIKLFAINTDGTERRISGSYFFTVE